MIKTRNIIFAGIMLALVLSMGTAGYMILEGWNLLDALYMTVITVTTVGFSEVHPISDEARVLTMTILVSGLGVLGYLVGYGEEKIGTADQSTQEPLYYLWIWPRGPNCL
jgi:voltage-gated potassium channel